MAEALKNGVQEAEMAKIRSREGRVGCLTTLCPILAGLFTWHTGGFHIRGFLASAKREMGLRRQEVLAEVIVQDSQGIRELGATPPGKTDVHGRNFDIGWHGSNSLALQRPRAIHHVRQDRHALAVCDDGPDRLDGRRAQPDLWHVARPAPVFHCRVRRLVDGQHDVILLSDLREGRLPLPQEWVIV